MQTMFDLTGFQRDFLYCIAGNEEPYGLSIKHEIESYRDIEVSTGRLYSNLNKFVDKRYVSKGSIDDRTNSYELSAEGETLLVERQEWEAGRLPETRSK
jgi:DNA-binding PadR family transcriptional regulator